MDETIMCSLLISEHEAHLKHKHVGMVHTFFNVNVISLIIVKYKYLSNRCTVVLPMSFKIYDRCGHKTLD